MTMLYRHKPPGIYLDSIFASRLRGVKNLRYSIEADGGSFDLSVEVPYHPDDREADRLGRIEVHRLLSSASMAA